MHLRGALGEAMRLATEVNKYLDTTAPWTTIKTDRQAAGRAIYTALKAIEFAEGDAVAVPALHLREAAQLYGLRHAAVRRAVRGDAQGALGEHSVLRYNGEKATGRWEASQIEAGRVLRQPAPLFRKLDVKIVEEERARLERKKKINRDEDEDEKIIKKHPRETGVFFYYFLPSRRVWVRCGGTRFSIPGFARPPGWGRR